MTNSEYHKPAPGRFDRRRFIQTTAAAIGAVTLCDAAIGQEGRRPKPLVSLPTPLNLPYSIKKTLKIDMVHEGENLEEKFRIAARAGFEGIELNSPSIDVKETIAAIEEVDFPVDGTVCSSHWQIRHTSPKSDERAQALKDLKTAINETSAVGGDTVLLVVGHGNDGDFETIRKRSLDNIRGALELAEQKEIRIAIENVWNHFLYDHNGGNDQTADQLAEYVDEFDSPLVGVQFDIGNHWKFGNPGDWMRTLGDRIFKLDIKGFSRAENKFTQIAEGDLPWGDVRAALAELEFDGWCAAEVAGGTLNDLLKVSISVSQALINPMRQMPGGIQAIELEGLNAGELEKPEFDDQ